MKNIVVYWSGTGNTEGIANLIAQDVNADIKFVGDASIEEVLTYDTIILGCPAMGAEELEDVLFKPFYEELIIKVSSQRIFLFGSYDWGDGEWMRQWADDVLAHGVTLTHDGLIVNGDTSAIDDFKYNDFIFEINK
ncbi:MAG: flavodoxin [Erysipelotrichaceae bacterium]|nr:flavodoxin [Erysipelotrichaceae bacterium]